VVEDDRDMRVMLEEELQEEGYDVLGVASADEAITHLTRHGADAVVTDLIMPGMRGDQLLSQIRSKDADLPVVVMTAFGSIESAVDAMRAGATHYMAKPFQMDTLLHVLEQALQERERADRLKQLRQQFASGRRVLIGESKGMRQVMELVSRFAATDVSVLILGESGTGKELVAEALHLEGPRGAFPFVAVNCSAIPETMLESLLFGHRRGSFTDAREDRSGLFQQANGGTLFLDEIGDMPPALQARLLRALQERAVMPLGASQLVPVDVRVIAATNCDLERMCAEGRFRLDLYYRLNVMRISLPPLRDRLDDLLPLANHFLEKHAGRLKRVPPTLAPETLQALRRHSWPGNVRELENAIERALVISRGTTIALEDLPEALIASGPEAAAGANVRLLAEVEREEILSALKAAGGNKTAAARLLGLDRKTLYRKIAFHNIRGSVQ
jgi:two-component system, NtrC family, response regulator AtoC